MADRLKGLVRSPRFPALMLLAGWSIAALGYWGSWIWSPPAGLRILGIDLAEYVKFVAEVRSGELRIAREIFLLPLLALSLSMSLMAHRSELPLPGVLRWLVNILALPVALSLLPPAWTPALLTTPEFAKQTAAIVVCGLAALLSYPLLRRIPLGSSALAVSLIALACAFLPVVAFQKLRSPLGIIFGQDVAVGLGPVLLVVGLVLVATAPLVLMTSRKHPL